MFYKSPKTNNLKTKPNLEIKTNPMFRKLSALPQLLILFAGLVCVHCSNNRPNEEDIPSDIWNLPFFGFNAKGTLEVIQQTGYANSYFDQIKSKDIKENLVVRVTGGTQSQLTYGNDWTKDRISNWVALQKKHGIRFIYVVNGNDSPVKQANIIKKWLDVGAHFDFIEMMNEYYLPKYARGDTSFEEVTEEVTPEKYVDIILPVYWKQLDQFHLPYYLIFAPTRSNPGANAVMEHWNEVLTTAIQNKYPNRQLNATIHLYIQNKNDISQFDYGQIDRLRSTLPSGRHIAVTEAGVINKDLDYQMAGEMAIAHYRKILEHLRPKDYLLDQILYNSSKNNNTAALNPEYNGETPKGKAILQFILGKLQ